MLLNLIHTLRPSEEQIVLLSSPAVKSPGSVALIPEGINSPLFVLRSPAFFQTGVAPEEVQQLPAVSQGLVGLTQQL